MASPYEAFDPQKLPKDVFISSGTASNVKKYEGSNLVNLYNNNITRLSFRAQKVILACF
jgi:hypothetical protein